MGTVDIQALYERYAFVIFGRCRKILRSEDDARDAMQAVFLKLIEHVDSLRAPEAVVSWIFQAAQNHCFNMLRERKKYADAEALEYVAAAGPDAERTLGDKELVRMLTAGVPKKIRDAVYFTFVDELSQEEIRRVTGQSPATIRRNLGWFRRHVDKLKNRLQS